jgi:hypothetical protein
MLKVVLLMLCIIYPVLIKLILLFVFWGLILVIVGTIMFVAAIVIDLLISLYKGKSYVKRI